jgi:hypothetical protein
VKIGYKMCSASKGLREDTKLLYGYGGCTTRREDNKEIIGENIEVEDYGGDGHD